MNTSEQHKALGKREHPRTVFFFSWPFNAHFDKLCENHRTFALHSIFQFFITVTRESNCEVQVNYSVEYVGMCELITTVTASLLHHAWK